MGSRGLTVAAPPPLPPHLTRAAEAEVDETHSVSAGDAVERVPAGRWKLLKDIPTLCLGYSTPWEAGMGYFSWRAQMTTVCRSMSSSFGAYVEACWSKAQELYKEQASSRIKTVPPVVSDANVEWDSRFTGMLLRTVPEELKVPVIEEAKGLTISATDCFVAICSHSSTAGRRRGNQ